MHKQNGYVIIFKAIEGVRMNENMNINEKKLYAIIGLGLFAILLVILFSIPWGGDKKKS